MDTDTNPLFRLARKGKEENLTERELVELASCKEFQQNLRPADFEQVVSYFNGHYMIESSADLPSSVFEIAIACSQGQELKPETIGLIHFAYACYLLHTLEWDRGLVELSHAKTICEQNGLDPFAALVDVFMDFVSLASGKEKCGKHFHEKLMSLPPDLEDNLPLNISDLLRQGAYCFLGEPEKGLTLVNNNKELYEEDPVFAPSDNSLIAQLYFMSGQYDRALAIFESTAGKLREAKRDRLAGQLDIGAAGVYFRLGRTDQAIRILERLIGTLRDPGDKFVLAECLTLLGSAYGNHGDFDQGIKNLNRANKIWVPKGPVFWQIICSLYLAQTHRWAGNLRKAWKHVYRARRISENHDHALGKLMCLSEFAYIKGAMGKYEEAACDLRQLMDSNLHWSPVQDITDYFTSQGLLFESRSQFDRAQRWYGQAIDIVEDVRSRIRLESGKWHFLESEWDVYHHIIVCCLKCGDNRSALEYLERLKSRALADVLNSDDSYPAGVTEEERQDLENRRSQLGILEYQLSKEPSSEVAAHKSRQLADKKIEYELYLDELSQRYPEFDPDYTAHISYDDISRLVYEPSTAMIYLYPMEEQTIAFVLSLNRRPEERTVIIDNYDLHALDADLQRIHDKDELDVILRRLYEKLYAPIKPYLSGVTKLIFVPYSGLHLIPLHAMFTEENGSRKYLIDDHLITYAPSAKVLKQCLSLERSENQRVFVAAANPRGDLPYAPREAEAIGGLFETEVNWKTTRQDLINKGREAHILHYTGHAGGYSLSLHGPANGGEDRYELEDIFVSLDLPHSWLVTLSACDTGKVKSGKTDEYIGLPSAFLQAGAATVISSLWPVSDISTTLLMSQMYKLIDGGSGKAEALRRAQIWLKNPNNTDEHLRELRRIVPWMREPLDQGIPDTMRFHRTVSSGENLLPKDLHRPYYWAGFVCTGAP